MSSNHSDKARKQRILLERVKQGQTSHWDLDMLSHEELEALMGGSAPAENAGEETSGEENPGDESARGSGEAKPTPPSDADQ